MHTSLRFSRPDWSNKFGIRRAIITLAMIVLLFFGIRTPHGSPHIPIPYLIMVLDVLGILCIRHMGDLEYGMDLLPFVATLLVGILLQSAMAGGYYQRASAFSSLVLLLAMIVCVIMMVQKGYAATIWKMINAFSLFSAGCIIFQMAAKAVGIRVDHMGSISDWLFNSWEFSSAYRPCGPFLEPAMFAQLGLLSLYHYLFLNRNWWKAGFTALALLLSTSALGLMGMLLLGVVFLSALDKLCGVRRRTKYLILVAALVGGLALFGLLMYLGSYSLERALSGSSLDVRFLRSVDLFQLLSPTEKLIGIGLQNQQRYLNYYGIILAHDTYETTIGANREFASVLGYLPCATGIFGLVTFIFPFYRVFVRGGIRSKAAVMIFMFTCLFCCILTSCIFVVYIMAVYATFDMDRRLARSAQAAERSGQEETQ